MFRYVALLAAILTVVIAELYHLNAEESNALLMHEPPVMIRCMKEFDVRPSDWSESNKDKPLDPCFLACCLKGNNLINEKGMFDEQEANEIAKLFVKNEESMEKAKELNSKCAATVNDAKVSDGDQGCERAKLLMECLTNQKIH